ncbi:hypothetical protein ACFL0V_06770, partial [Nanoarchaeota archaeon]
MRLKELLQSIEETEREFRLDYLLDIRDALTNIDDKIKFDRANDSLIQGLEFQALYQNEDVTITGGDETIVWVQGIESLVDTADFKIPRSFDPLGYVKKILGQEPIPDEGYVCGFRVTDA